MTDYLVSVPEDVYARAQRIGEETAQSAEQVIVNHLHTLTDTSPTLPLDEEAELDALKHLSDDALWTIAREQMAENLQAQMSNLMDKHSLGTLTPDELDDLAELVERGQRLMVRKSEAMALLTNRGQKVTPNNLITRE